MQACLFCNLPLPQEPAGSLGSQCKSGDYETVIFGEVPEGLVLYFSYINCETCERRLWKEQSIYFRQRGIDPSLYERKEYMWARTSEYARQLLAEGKQLPEGNWHRFEVMKPARQSIRRRSEA